MFVKRLDVGEKKPVFTSAPPHMLIVAEWMYQHPGRLVEVNDTFFLFDIDTLAFWYCKPGNKKHNSWYVANGLTSEFRKMINGDPVFGVLYDV